MYLYILKACICKNLSLKKIYMKQQKFYEFFFNTYIMELLLK